MLWSAVILLAASLSVESYGSHDLHERLVHGRQLRIFLPKNVEKLEFTPADDPARTFLYWENGKFRLTKGSVLGVSNDRRWLINKVTYEDQGTYTQRDYWNKEIFTVKVAVTPRHNQVKCVAGESLYISLEGIDLADADLTFSGEAGNFTLVRDGAPVSQDLPNYWNRVQTHSLNIEIRNVNYSDVGRYNLTDGRKRWVSVTRMDLTDRHESPEEAPLMALLLLLGIPVGICCCCRKKIFKKKASMMLQTADPSDVVYPPPGGPAGPAPPYNPPGQPGVGPTVYPPPSTTGPGQWNGPPSSPGYNPAYPPQNLVYTPLGPAMIPPAQPPQWNGPPPGHYPPGPVAPMGYAQAPVMYGSFPPAAASEPAKEEVKMENMASSPADPLLTHTPQAEAAASPVPSSFSSVLASSDSAHQFHIDGIKKSTNFL